MIVICAGMSRSGSTLQYQIISELVERSGRGEGKGSWNYNKPVPEDKEKIFVYKSEQYIDERIDEVDHAFSVIRNPLDVAVSLYRYRLAKEHYACTGMPIPLEGVLYGEMFSVMTWIQKWEEFGSHMVCYEDLHPDRWHNIAQQAASVLGIEISIEEAKSIAGKFTLKENQARISNQNKWFDYTDSMLTLGHIGPNYGKPGEGKRYLSKNQIGYIMRYAGDFMDRYEYI